jgi:hypothetical protein
MSAAGEAKARRARRGAMTEATDMMKHGLDWQFAEVAS